MENIIIEKNVLNVLENRNFQDFINKTYISGGSESLKEADVNEEIKNECKKVITSLEKEKEQAFLHIIGISGSGKSKVVETLKKEKGEQYKILSIDEKLKAIINQEEIQDYKLFKTNNTFDEKKFEYAMCCAFLLSGIYNEYIIDHGGGSPLQPGFQALSFYLAKEKNLVIHLSIDEDIISQNITHDILINDNSVKIPVIKAINEKISEKKFNELREKYKNLYKNEKKLLNVTERLQKFEQKFPNEKPALEIFKNCSKQYVMKNTWRKNKFENFFKTKVETCESTEKAANQIIARWL